MSKETKKNGCEDADDLTNRKRKGGRKGGRSKSRVKVRAARLNIAKARQGRVLAAQVRLLENMIVKNREVWLATKGSDERALLDREFEKLLKRKERLIQCTG